MAPSIAGVVIVALLVRSMDAIRYFDIITVTTNGGPGNTTKIIPIRLYETAFRFFDLGYAAAIGLGMLVFSILVANVFVRILESRGLRDDDFCFGPHTGKQVNSTPSSSS